jgi:hypothetical protein
MKTCSRFELTYLMTIRAKVVMFGIKPKVMKFRFVLTYLLKDHSATYVR